MQAGLFLLSIAVGARFIWMINRANWRVVMKQVRTFTHLDRDRLRTAATQCPPLATLWVYCILQLDLGPAVLGLTFVAIYVWVTGLKLAF